MDLVKVTQQRAPTAWALDTLDDQTVAMLAQATLAFLDTASTAYGRATAYNDRATQDKAERAVHDRLRDLDRRLYALLLSLPGLTDRSRQLGLAGLLGTRADADADRTVLDELASALPAPRLLKLFTALRSNNARTRKLVLRTLLGAARLELWSVKYRDKLGHALTHAWGVRTTSIVRSILGKAESTWTDAEKAIVSRTLDRFARDARVARASVGFALRAAVVSTLPLHVAHAAAKVELGAGASLPLEVLAGLRSTYHKGASKDDVLRLVARTSSLTEGQRIRVQRRAEVASIEVAFDPRAHDAVELYLYAFARGMTREIEAALDQKGAEVARALGLEYGSIGILLDASGSMAGSK